MKKTRCVDAEVVVKEVSLHLALDRGQDRIVIQLDEEVL